MTMIGTATTCKCGKPRHKGSPHCLDCLRQQIKNTVGTRWRDRNEVIKVDMPATTPVAKPTAKTAADNTTSATIAPQNGAGSATDAIKVGGLIIPLASIALVDTRVAGTVEVVLNTIEIDRNYKVPINARYMFEGADALAVLEAFGGSADTSSYTAKVDALKAEIKRLSVEVANANTKRDEALSLVDAQTDTIALLERDVEAQRQRAAGAEAMLAPFMAAVRQIGGKE